MAWKATFCITAGKAIAAACGNEMQKTSARKGRTKRESTAFSFDFSSQADGC